MVVRVQAGTFRLAKRTDGEGSLPDFPFSPNFLIVSGSRRVELKLTIRIALYGCDGGSFMRYGQPWIGQR